MGRIANTVYTQKDDIGRLERFVTELPSDAHVRITDVHGRIFEGTVIERPALQLFDNANGVQGFNAILRLDDAHAPDGTAYLWLGDIHSIEHMIA